MIYLDPHKWYEFPADVACCPICGAPVLVGDFDEWETETGTVTECGFHIDCKNEPDEDDEEYDDWFNGHWSMPYVDWLPLQTRLYEWFTARYRLRLPTQHAPDAGDSAASSGIVNASAESTSQAEPTPTQRG